MEQDNTTGVGEKATSTNNSSSIAISNSNSGNPSRRMRRTDKGPDNRRTGQAGATGQRKRRRGKTKRNRRSNNQKSVNWHLPIVVPGYPLVPYNTNRFLMEYHMPEVEQRGDIGRDGEEFLTNEFSTVYETAKCERLESLTKQQLVEEYLQLESNYDQLCQRLKTGSSHGNVQLKWEAQVRALKEQLRRVTSENRALKAQLRVDQAQSQPSLTTTTTTVQEEGSVDSESDSSFSSISTISRSSSSSSSPSSSSSSGSCCSSRCSSRDSRGNVLPQLLADNAEEAPLPALMNGDEEAAEDDVVMQERPAFNNNNNHHHRHRTHRQRRNSRLMHQSRQRQDAEEVEEEEEGQPEDSQPNAPSDLVVVENGHGKEEY